MEVLQLPDYRLRYSYRRPDGSLRIYTQDEIFHMRGLSSNGIVGLSPLSAAREVIGAAIATQAYGSRLFSNDARPGGILEHPGKIGEDAAVRLRQSWTAAHSGVGNSHKVAVLEEGMTFKALSMSAEDSQFLQTREFQVGEIARIFRIPPHMIGDLKRATFSNIEQQAIEFTTHTIRPWLVRWEQAIARDLIPDGEVFAEHNVDALLRGDLSGRYAAYAVGIQNGWLSSNEIRSLENLNPIEGGDEYHSVQIPLAPPPEPSTKPIVAPAEPPED
jgi:HK97 family phage portal protein